jgi:methylated-DNA-[protein]-cysteine S-methyltransferase
MYKAYYKSDIGTIEITGDEDGITAVDFTEQEPPYSEIPPCLADCVSQLDEYFRKDRKEFSLNLKLQGTEFQKKVWGELLKIPYGTTASYADIAKAVGNEKCVRAVGNTNGRNKIAIIIPCHRVIGKDGSLTGYAGGLWRKEWLLKHEGVI